uniref:Secreted protein n=1 Tax=Angiostrongylus cantonensis TaxID=6313 RepID=A0A0K0DB44_ANGCA
MMSFILLALIGFARADGYGVPSPAQSVAPAPAPYGAPYSSNAAALQQQQPVQYQPYTNLINQPVPIGIQHGLTSYPPTIYGMYSTQPQQLSQGPYQMYGQQPIPSSLYMNYPQGMVPRPQPQQHPQHVQQAQQQQQQQQAGMTSVPSQAGMAGLPSGAMAYLASSYLPSTSLSSAAPTGYAAHPTITGPTMEREPTVAVAAMSAFTGLTSSTVDPWASLSGMTTKKTDNRKKKNSEGI